MTNIAERQARYIAKQDILDEYRGFGIPEDDLANQIALDLVLEREKAADWRKNYENLLVKYEALSGKA